MQAKRDKVLKVLLTRAELAAVKKKAGDTPLSEYGRDAMLGTQRGDVKPSTRRAAR